MNNSNSTKRSQFLDYNLIRSGRFNSNELALLNVIITFSDRCEMSQGYLAKAINKSIPTIRRTINGLIKKGIVTRSYTVFKRCVIRIVSLDVQKSLMTISGILKQAIKSAKKHGKNLIKSNYRSPVSELNRSPMIEPTRSKTEEIKHIKIDKKLELKPKAIDLNRTKEEALARFKAIYCN